MNTNLDFTAKSKMQDALNVANAGYIARKGASARLTKSGYQPDIATARDLVNAMTDDNAGAILALCASAEVDLCAGLRDVHNVKVSKRIVQFLGFVQTGDLMLIQGSARTALHEISAILNGAANRESLHFAATGTTREGANEVTLRDQGIARKLRKIAGNTKTGSEQTQNSVTFSAGGICSILGIAKKDSRKSFPVLNATSPVLRAMLDRVNTISEGAINMLIENREEKATRKGKGK